MARIETLKGDQVPDSAKETFDEVTGYGPFASLAGAMAQRPPVLNRIFGLLGDLRDEGVLDRRSLELALVAVSKLNACDYCVAHHSPMLNVVGASKEAIDNILDYDNVAEFDAKDRLVIEYSRQVTMDPNRVRDAIFDSLREYFSEPQIVELTWRIALCGAFNRFNDVLQLDIEDDAHAAMEQVA
jgi:uncharacterized peroxidase-related enzyme